VKKAPAFCLPDQNGKTICLKNLLGNYVVLYFYPKDNTPGCTTEAIDFTKNKDAFAKLGAVIIGISSDDQKSHCSFIENHKLDIILLSDPDKRVIKEYGAWGEKSFMGKTFDGIIRSTFLIDRKGSIVFEWKKVKVAGHAQEILEKIKSLSDN